MTEELPFLRKLTRTQRFTLGAPHQFRPAPDGSRVLFLRSADGYDDRQDLWSIEPASGRESKVVDVASLVSDADQPSAEEQARRERSREAGGGVLRYSVDAGCTTAAFTLADSLFTVDIDTQTVTEHSTVHGGIVDPSLNPQGTHLAYGTHGTLRVISLASGQDTELIADADDEVSWGIAEFIAAEELGRSSGYWWSPGGQFVLAQRSDSSGVPRWSIADPANPASSVRTVGYPAAGSTNVAVSLAIIGLDGSFVPVEAGEWEYLVAAHWSEGGPPLIAVQSRDQRRMEVRGIDIADGSTSVLYSETDPEHWVELAAGVPAWTPDGRLVRIGAVSGSYRLLIDGQPVTEPGLNVRSVLDVSAEVLFSASGADPTQIHVYRTDGDTVRPVSSGRGVHIGAGTTDVSVLSTWCLEYSGPTVRVLRPGEPEVPVESYTAEPGIEPNLTMLSVGERGLRAALLLPTGYRREHGPLPVLLDPYAGPHAQRVLATRNAYLSSQWFADQGFAVLVIDGRGTPGRGPAWEKEVAGDLGETALADQVAALNDIAAEHPELDLDHVAIRGWSYGGYLAALAVLRRGDVFHAAIAGAPVTDWSLYDTHYTERYLGRPEQDPETYRRNSLLDKAADLGRPLMIVHGLADDNVFVAHALRLSSALLSAGKSHTFLPLVGATHMTPKAEVVVENLLSMQVDWLRRELQVGQTMHGANTGRAGENG